MKSKVSVLLAFVAIAFGACMSAPKVTDPSGVDVDVMCLTPTQAIMTFGSAPNEPNPYRTPGGVIISPHELVVLRITIAAAHKAAISINDITASNPDGDSVAHFNEPEQFIAYIDGWKSPITAQNVQIVRNTYIPGTNFTSRTGRHSYYAVLIGKNPIPRPFQVKVDISVDNGDSRFFTFDVVKK